MRKWLIWLAVVLTLGLVFAFSGSVFLVSPENKTYTRNSVNDFSFYFIDPVNQTTSCSLYIDSAMEAENNTVFNNTVTIFSGIGPLTNGTHSWFVRCDSTDSEQRILTVDQAEPIVKWLRPVSYDGGDAIPVNLVLRNSTFTLKIKVNGTFSPWDKLNIDISNCGGYLEDESGWNETEIDETTSRIEIDWNTSDTVYGECNLTATANDSVNLYGNNSVTVYMTDMFWHGVEFLIFNISYVDVRPDNPTTDHNLTCHWNASMFFGLWGVTNYTADVTWFKNSVRYTNWDVKNITCRDKEECKSPVAVPASATEPGETWTCQVSAFHNNMTFSKNGTESIYKPGNGGDGGRDRDENRTGGDGIYEAPLVRLISPIDGATLETLRPTFKYYVDDIQDQTLSCTLYIGSLKIPSLAYDADISVAIETINEFKPTVDLAEETYTWRVECSDSSGDLGESDSWYFTVSLPLNATEEINETIQAPLAGAAIVSFFKGTTPWIGILSLVLLGLVWIFYKRVTEKELEE